MVQRQGWTFLGEQSRVEWHELRFGWVIGPIRVQVALQQPLKHLIKNLQAQHAAICLEGGCMAASLSLPIEPQRDCASLLPAAALPQALCSQHNSCMCWLHVLYATVSWQAQHSRSTLAFLSIVPFSSSSTSAVVAWDFAMVHIAFNTAPCQRHVTKHRWSMSCSCLCCCCVQLLLVYFVMMFAQLLGNICLYARMQQA